MHRDPPSNELWVCHLGIVPYSDGIAIQETLRDRRLAQEVPDTLLLLEHPPTYTRGRRSAAQELPFPATFYEAKGIEVHATDRGGRITYHGPGQLVGYPIMAVRDVGRHVRTMEDSIVSTLEEIQIRARSRPHDGSDYTGVWVQDRKIASIGVHVRKGVSTHGFAVNVANDLDPFSWVVACGLPDVEMTSVEAEARRSNPRRADYDSAAPGSGLQCFRRLVAYAFAVAHGRRQRLVSPPRLGIDAAPNRGGAPVGAEPHKSISTPPVEAVPA